MPAFSTIIKSMAKCLQYNTLVSHRSGETPNSFIAELTVAVSTGHLKIGSGCRSERIEKFNQLIRIEHELGNAFRFAGNKAVKTHNLKGCLDF